MRAKNIKSKQSFLLLSLFFSGASFGQQLLETKEGDLLFNPIISTNAASTTTATGLIKTNITDQSIGGEFFYKLPHTAPLDPTKSNKFNFITGGIKAKPTEGYGAVFKNGQFSPAANFTFSLNRFKLLDANLDQATATANDNFTDWGGIYFGLNVNKYQLYRSDTTFAAQLYSKVFNGGSIGLNYNMLLYSQFLLSAKLGYSRKANFSDLDEVEVKDIKSEYDPVSLTTRTVTTTKTARIGEKYAEFDSYNLTIALTRLTQGGAGSAIKMGYSAYFDLKSSSIAVTTANVGVILFLAQAKNYISTPLIGFDFQFADVSNNKKSETGLFKRFSLGLTSTIPIR
ncbi:MAG TPA: hypothetical protein VK151_08615 [Fluviicola sp.]|nr:hypothetical protein [Fluviicola sp.]